MLYTFYMKILYMRRQNIKYSHASNKSPLVQWVNTSFLKKLIEFFFSFRQFMLEFWKGWEGIFQKLLKSDKHIIYKFYK